MPSFFDCVTNDTLPSIVDPDCLQLYGNIQLIALQIKQASPTFTGTSIILPATWTNLIAETDETAIRIVQATNFTTTPGEAISEGGNDQTTYRGRRKIKGGGFTDARFEMQGVDNAYAKSAGDFTKYSVLPNQRTKLRAFFLTDENYILSSTDYNGVEIWGWFVQDSAIGNAFKQETSFPVTFGMDYGWSFDVKATKAPDTFDILSLANI